MFIRTGGNKLILDTTWTDGISDPGGQSTIFRFIDSYGAYYALKFYNRCDNRILNPAYIDDRCYNLMTEAYFHDVQVPSE